MAVAFILIFLFLAIFIKPKIQIDKNTLLISLFGALNFVFFMFAINFMPAVIAPIFFSLVPIEVTLFSYLLFREKVSSAQLIGIIVGYFGAIIVLSPSFSNAQGSEVRPIGIVLVLLASSSIAMHSLLIQRSNNRYSPYNLSFQSIGVALIFSIPILIVAPRTAEIAKDFNFNVVWFFLGIAAIGTISQYLSFQHAIGKIQASANVVFFYFQPVFTITMSLIFLDESISIIYVIGLVFVLIGSSLNLGMYTKIKNAISNKKITGS